MGFGGGMPGNLGKMMKQVEEMQRKMERVQVELGEERVEATVGGGMVTAVVDGLGSKVFEVRVQPEVVDPDDIETLQDLVTAAMNEALRKASDYREERMAEVTSGMNIPGMGQLPGFGR